MNHRYPRRNLHEDKEPLPLRPLQESTQEQCPKISSHGRGRSEHTETEISHPTGGIGARDHCHGIWHDESSPEPRQCAHGNKCKEVVAEGAGESADGEPGTASQEELSMTVDITQSTTDQHESTLCQTERVSICVIEEVISDAVPEGLTHS